MDGIANVARQQQSQVGQSDTHAKVAQQATHIEKTQTQTQTKVQTHDIADVVKEMAKEAKDNGTKINSKDDVQNLVKKLNHALSPMHTSLKFGVDSQDIFYVSVIDTQTDKMIRRFPAEQAQDFLPKMQEVTGILFDHKG